MFDVASHLHKHYTKPYLHHKTFVMSGLGKMRLFAPPLLLLLLSVSSSALRPLHVQKAGARELRQAPPQLTQRVVFSPNQRQNNKAQDYIANVYLGAVTVAEADPAVAGAGVGVGGGVQLQYDKSSYFDYEVFRSRADIGPGSKLVGAAVARILGIATAKAAGRNFIKSNLSYKRDAANENAVAVGTVNELGSGLSGGIYLDRSGNENSALLQTPPVNFAFGKH